MGGFAEMRFDKLVRDKIPEVVKNKYLKTPVIHIAKKSEYEECLKNKLQEEVAEFLVDNNEEELADILEVVYALASVKNIGKAQLEEIRKKKFEERGGFEKKIILEEVK